MVTFIFHKKYKQSGFTLIELLIVIGIIGILASVVLVSLNSAREKSRNAGYASQLKQYQNALEMYFSDHGTYPITSGYACIGIGHEGNSCTYGGVYPESSSASISFRSLLSPYIDTTTRASPQSGTYKGALYRELNSGKNYSIIYLLEGANLSCTIGGGASGGTYATAGYTRCDYIHPL